MKIKRFFWAVIILIDLAIFSFIILEISLSVKYGWKRPRQDYKFGDDPLLGWGHKPNSNFHYKSEEFDVNGYYDAQGFVGETRPFHKEKGIQRIVCMGDSFAEANDVAVENRFSEILENHLNRNPKKFQIINLGVWAYSTDQELLLFQNFGKLYNPDLVILFFYLNDVLDNTKTKLCEYDKPLFKAAGSNLELISGRFQKSASLNIGSKMEKNSFLDRIKFYLSNNSYAYRYLSRKIKKIHWLYELVKKIGYTKGPDVPGQYISCAKKEQMNLNDNWALTALLISAFKKEVLESGAKFVIFYVPDLYSVYPDLHKNFFKEHGANSDDYDFELPVERIREICEHLDIPLIEPTDKFTKEAQGLAKKGRTLYFMENGHWNENGHRLVAQILKEYISTEK